MMKPLKSTKDFESAFPGLTALVYGGYGSVMFIRSTLALLVMLSVTAGCARIRPPQRMADAEGVMTATGYCSCGKCCGWKRTWYGRPVSKATGKRKRVGQTASGQMARHGTIAAPSKYPFGTIMYVEGYGYGRVQDRGGAIKGNRIDLWFSNHRKALSWGKRKVKVQVWYPKKSRR